MNWSGEEAKHDMKNALSAIADANGWLVRVEWKHKGEVVLKSHFLVVVEKGKPKIRGMWCRCNAKFENLMKP